MIKKGTKKILKITCFILTIMVFLPKLNSDAKTIHHGIRENLAPFQTPPNLVQMKSAATKRNNVRADLMDDVSLDLNEKRHLEILLEKLGIPHYATILNMGSGNHPAKGDGWPNIYNIDQPSSHVEPAHYAALQKAKFLEENFLEGRALLKKLETPQPVGAVLWLLLSRFIQVYNSLPYPEFEEQALEFYRNLQTVGGAEVPPLNSDKKDHILLAAFLIHWQLLDPGGYLIISEVPSEQDKLSKYWNFRWLLGSSLEKIILINGENIDPSTLIFKKTGTFPKQIHYPEPAIPANFNFLISA